MSSRELPPFFLGEGACTYVYYTYIYIYIHFLHIHIIFVFLVVYGVWVGG